MKCNAKKNTQNEFYEFEQNLWTYNKSKNLKKNKQRNTFFLSKMISCGRQYIFL